MPDALEQLVDSLLYEGYALYPYTPGATKNATPTPFGIVYPPAYAQKSSSTFDHLELRCLLRAPSTAVLSTNVRFLAASGERHQASARHVRLDDTTVAGLLGRHAGDEGFAAREVEVEGTSAGELRVAVGMTARPRDADTYEVALRIENRTPCPEDLDRPLALGHSLLSTHPILSVSGGRFISPLDSSCASVNTFPVLATASDDAVIGAAIVLPDHPQIAPESRGGMFDSTEIEEALLLHVHALSDAEREEIERHDPAVREMVARAAAATPDDILALHGRVTLKDPVTAAVRSRVSDVPPQEPPDLLDPREGEPESEVDGVRFCKGGKVRIRPGLDADVQARMLDGRTATVERILIDYDGKTHLGVTIDGDPGQDLMRESGRLLYFFAPEVEVVS